MKHFAPNTQMSMPNQSHRFYCPCLSLRVFSCIVLGSTVVKTKITLVPDPYCTPVLLGRSGKASPCFWARYIEPSMMQVQAGKCLQYWKCCCWEPGGLSSCSSCFPCQVSGSLLGCTGMSVWHWAHHSAGTLSNTAETMGLLRGMSPRLLALPR